MVRDAAPDHRVRSGKECCGEAVEGSGNLPLPRRLDPIGRDLLPRGPGPRLGRSVVLLADPRHPGAVCSAPAPPRSPAGAGGVLGEAPLPVVAPGRVPRPRGDHLLRDVAVHVGTAERVRPGLLPRLPPPAHLPRARWALHPAVRDLDHAMLCCGDGGPGGDGQELGHAAVGLGAPRGVPALHGVLRGSPIPTAGWPTLAVCLPFTAYFVGRTYLRLYNLAAFGVEMTLAYPLALYFLWDRPGWESELGLLIAVGIGSVIAMSASVGASSMLPIPLCGLLSYVEPMLLVVAAIILGEQMRGADAAVYAILAAALALLAFAGFRDMRRLPKPRPGQ